MRWGRMEEDGLFDFVDAAAWTDLEDMVVRMHGVIRLQDDSSRHTTPMSS